MNMRQFSRLDEAIMHLDNVLSGFSNMRPPNAKREYPAESLLTMAPVDWSRYKFECPSTGIIFISSSDLVLSTLVLLASQD